MKLFRSHLSVFVVLLCVICTGRSQSTFQNLDFEAATLVPIVGDPYDRVQFSLALPGWTGYTAIFEQGAMYNRVFLDSSGIGIVDRNWTNGFGASLGGVIEGNFSALLMAGLSREISPVPADTTLSQTGLVPADALSLRFKAHTPAVGPNTLIVTLGGQRLSLTPLGNGTNYTLYGADISSWAGQSVELDFTMITERPHVSNRYGFLDSIEFSPVAIPEPGAVALIGVGAALIGTKRLREKS